MDANQECAYIGEELFFKT